MIEDKAKFFGKGKGEERNHYFGILTDHLDGHKATDEEKKSAKKKGLDTFFELFDDDGIKYYSGYMNLDLMYDNDLDEFTILDMAMADSGCTEMKTRNKESGKMEIV